MLIGAADFQLRWNLGGSGVTARLTDRLRNAEKVTSVFSFQVGFRFAVSSKSHLLTFSARPTLRPVVIPIFGVDIFQDFDGVISITVGVGLFQVSALHKSQRC